MKVTFEVDMNVMQEIDDALSVLNTLKSSLLKTCDDELSDIADDDNCHNVNACICRTCAMNRYTDEHQDMTGCGCNVCVTGVRLGFAIRTHTTKCKCVFCYTYDKLIRNIYDDGDDFDEVRSAVATYCDNVDDVDECTCECSECNMRRVTDVQQTVVDDLRRSIMCVRTYERINRVRAHI